MELTTAVNPYEAFAAAAASMAGGESKPILRFEKGDWYAGQDKEELPLGTKLAADMLHAEWGWVRWQDGKPSERKMVLIASGQQPASRSSLGEMDQGIWPVDPTSHFAKDPWAKTIEIPVREVAGKKREFILAGGSKGHEGACKELFGAFGTGMRENAGKVPVIELRAGKYDHPKWGKVMVPSMPIVEWAALDTPATKKVTAKTNF